MLLAIDPGPVQTALVEWDGDALFDGNAALTLLPHTSRRGRIAGRWLVPNAEALSIVSQTGAEAVAVEMIASYGMPVGRDVFETALWVGRFIERAAAAGKRVRTVYRKEIKLHLCQSLRAKDANIRQALIDRLGEPGTKKAPGVTHGMAKDLWAALAVAVFAHDCPQAGEARHAGASPLISGCSQPPGMAK